MAKKPTRQMWKRAIVILMVTALVGFGGDLISLARIQLLDNEQYQMKAEQQQLSDTVINAQRGTIYSSNMVKLARSASVWTVYVVPANFKKDSERELVADSLCDILEIDREDAIKAMTGTSHYMVLARRIENPVKDQVSKFILENEFNNKMGLTEDNKRYYPGNQLLSNLLGFTGTDNQGLSGVEAYYDKYLTGTPGREVKAKDAVQETLPSQYKTRIDPIPGNNIVLTIDEVMQYYMEKNLEQVVKDTGSDHATGILVNVKTGDILAMATKPDYDPNHPWDIADETEAQRISLLTGDERRQALNAAQNKQWRNAAVSDTYEPGSVFKAITAAGALEEKVVSETDAFTCTGSVTVAGNVIHCHKRSGHGQETFAEGLMNSCNPVFVAAGQRLGSHLFFKYFKGFGLTEKTGIDLPGEAQGIYYQEEKLGISELSSEAFGQTFQVTPMQMVMSFSAIGNGGRLMEPHVLKQVLDEKDNVISTVQPTVKRQVISEETAAELLLMLERVVKEGTGKNAYIPGYRVAGKTGTSEKVGKYNEDGSKKYIASFAGIAPVEDPQFAIIIEVDEPRNGSVQGGAIAAPLAAAILKDILTYKNIEPHYTQEELEKLDIAVPDVVEDKLATAKNKLRAAGLDVRVVGDGEAVVRQFPAAGQTTPKGGTIVLYTTTDGNAEKTKVPNLTNLTISQANIAAGNAGLNMKITGNALESAGTISYSQNIPAETEVEIGTVITVSFRQTQGIEDPTDH